MERDNPLVSVIMPVYNTERYVKGTVESILNQTYTDFEFIIIDDGSTDKTGKILNSFIDKRLRIFRQSNQGVIKALNRALEECKGAYIAVQGADDISVRNRLEIQVNFLESHPEIAGVGSYVLLMRENGEALLCRRQIHPDAIRKIQQKGKGTGVTHGSMMHRRSVIEVIGVYDERFRFGAGDYDFILRMAERFDLSNIPQPLYIIREHQGQMSNSYRRENWRNAVLARRLARERMRARKIVSCGVVN